MGFDVPDLKHAKSIVVCRSDNDGLARLCVFHETTIVQRICKTIDKTKPGGGPKIFLEPGPIVVICGDNDTPIIALMYRLDGWVCAYSIEKDGKLWKLGNQLTKKSEFFTIDRADGSSELINNIWLYSLGENVSFSKCAVPEKGQLPEKRPNLRIRP